MPHYTRRQFGQAAAVASIGTALSARRVLGANDRVRVGFIGVGNRGDQVLDGFLKHADAEIVALCDIHPAYVDFAAKKAGGQPQPFKDYRKLLEMKDLDAVAVCTPDHWHALQMIHACEAGKDVYVEKPASLVVAEGRAMANAARRFKRVVQVGLQRRSSAFVREAVQRVRGGSIGKVTVVRSFHIQNEWPKGIDNPPDEAPPPGFDWDAWLGPAPKKAYNRNRTFYRFRWFRDYSGGQLTNFGVHYMDVIQWALGQDAPLAVTAIGGKFAVADNREVPDTLEVLWLYPNGTLVTFSQYNATAAPAGLKGGEIEFRGTKGTLYLRGNGYEIVPDEITPNAFPARTPVDRTLERGWRTGAKPLIEPASASGQVDTADHVRNFLDGVKSRGSVNCDMETGHRSTAATLLGNIAYDLKAHLQWDGQRERFTNDDRANQRLDYAYRPPYKLPEYT
jgi:predicted dehydrogenase